MARKGTTVSEEKTIKEAAVKYGAEARTTGDETSGAEPYDAFADPVLTEILRKYAGLWKRLADL